RGTARAELARGCEQAEPSKPAHEQADKLILAQHAESQLWQSWGIDPDIVLGNGISECTAACVAGVFTLEDARNLVRARARVTEDPSDRSAFEKAASEIHYSSPQIRIIASSNGKSLNHNDSLDAQY